MAFYKSDNSLCVSYGVLLGAGGFSPDKIGAKLSFGFSWLLFFGRKPLFEKGVGGNPQFSSEGRSKAKQSEAKRSKAKRSEAKRSKAKQSEAKRSKAKQSEAKQSEAKRSKAKQSGCVFLGFPFFGGEAKSPSFFGAKLFLLLFSKKPPKSFASPLERFVLAKLPLFLRRKSPEKRRRTDLGGPPNRFKWGTNKCTIQSDQRHL